MSKNRPKKLILIGVCVIALAIAAFAGHVLLRSQSDGGLPLAVRWEGLWIDYNARDLGDSLNSCLGEPLFKTGRVMRSNVWFSGWSCAGVGNPNVIYSLNFAPEREERYFCRDGDKNKVGRHYNDFKLNDLEFTATWDEPGVTAAVCGFIRDEFVTLSGGHSILIHCDAGKDRTGANSALIAALAAEHAGRLDDKMLDALECDYRKSKRLETAKYGRIKSFIGELQAKGGVAKFIEERCGIDAATLASTARALLAPQSN